MPEIGRQMQKARLGGLASKVGIVSCSLGQAAVRTIGAISMARSFWKSSGFCST